MQDFVKPNISKRVRFVPFNTFLLFAIVSIHFSSNVVIAGEKINYRLKWLFNASVVGDIVADANDLFSQAGLDVTVKEGGPERDAIRELELGHAQFGVASADQVIRALAKGSPVVVIAQLFQVNPLQWVYRSQKVALNKLEDLRGQTIGITYGGNDETIMRTLLAKAGISDNEVTLFSVRYDTTPFYRNKVDIWPCYINSQGPLLSKKLGEAGEVTAFFNPADFGVQFVANSVVTSKNMLEKNPGMVKAFIKALLKGWQYALDMDNRLKTVEILQNFDKDTPKDLLAQQLELTKKLVQPKSGLTIGAIDVAAWQQTESILFNQKLISKRVHVENELKSQF